MSHNQANIGSGMSQERLYAAAQKAKLNAAHDPAKNDGSGKIVAQNTTGLKWQAVSGKKGKKDLSLARRDAVYLSTISPALSKDKVEAPLTASASRPVNFKQKAIKALSDKLGKEVQNSYSHNFFVAELGKLTLGICRAALSRFGLSPDDIQEIMASARAEKRGAIDTGIKEIASEKILFSIVTGAKVV